MAFVKHKMHGFSRMSLEWLGGKTVAILRELLGAFYSDCGGVAIPSLFATFGLRVSRSHSVVVSHCMIMSHSRPIRSHRET